MWKQQGSRDNDLFNGVTLRPPLSRSWEEGEALDGGRRGRRGRWDAGSGREMSGKAEQEKGSGSDERQWAGAMRTRAQKGTQGKNEAKTQNNKRAQNVKNEAESTVQQEGKKCQK